MIKQPKQRARNLLDKDIAAIVQLLDGWKGKLTWRLLIEAIAARFHIQYTRQALDRHTRIKQAFQLHKTRHAGSRPEGDSAPIGLSAAEAQVFLDRYGRMEAENARLKLENDRLLEQFVVWAYNANSRGLDAAFLNRALPPVDRDPTKMSRARERKSGSHGMDR